MPLTAPHEGKELAMVLAGSKPFGVIQFEKDPEQYVAVYDAQTTRRIYARTIQSGEVAFTLPTNRHFVDQYFDLITGVTKVADNKDYQRRMGKLFGYSDEEIEAFITGDIKCNCHMCKGVSHAENNS